ncbi:DNA polymerase III subunit delta [Mycoplasmopsis gallopavonis]|uniref:DNA-directed DNA polymerase n=1 Tax=Mycoplasmopsis gallopavonis TaxID=76629 RepID=A0A449AYZ7_9BACT|nr:hypothetical protein [Mycoplasmopsis gallopavonis]RIV16935.1 hypothetical protein D1113_00440 [Mycoplasmopsis gallopavonis]VEU72730.1 DNA polymerase III, delta subunit [Mycoplasmopsis gallopavonis]
MKLFYGEETFLIENKVKKLKSKYSAEQIVFLDENSTISDLVDAISSQNILGLARLILIKNFSLFKTKKLTKQEMKYANELLVALSYNELDEIVFIWETSKFVNNHFTEMLQRNSKLEVIYTEKINNKDLPNEIIRYVASKGNKISYLDAMYLLQKLPDNLALILQEVDKLILLNQPFSKTLIDENLSKYAVNTAFDFVNAIQEWNFQKIINTYKNHLYAGETTIQLLSQISWSFVLANQVYYLLQLQMSTKEVANFLKVNEYRVKIAQKQIQKYGIQKIQKIILNLEQLDRDLKSLNFDGIEIFEHFLINNFAI